MCGRRKGETATERKERTKSRVEKEENKKEGRKEGQEGDKGDRNPFRPRANLFLSSLCTVCPLHYFVPPIGTGSVL